MSTDLKSRREVARGEVELDGRRVRYAVIRSSRAKHIRLRILADGRVEIVAPTRGRLPVVADLLHSQQRWIHRRLDQLGALPAVPSNRVEFLGAECRIELTRSLRDTGRIDMHEQVLHLELPAGIPPAPVIEKFFRQRAREVLHDRARFWAQRMQVEYTRISIRDQRTRWGSCSVSGGLNFNWRLVMAPLPVLDYVVIHELMHRREMNHGRPFWDGVAEYCPDYDQHRIWLKQHGVRLTRPLAIDASENSPGTQAEE